MEKQFFEWDGWDQSDTICFLFTDCTLSVDVGNHKAGEKVPTIVMDYGNGRMQLIFDEDTTELYNIRLALEKV